MTKLRFEIPQQLVNLMVPKFKQSIHAKIQEVLTKEVMNKMVQDAAYAKFRDKKPIIGCLIVLEGQKAIFEPMPLGKKIIRKR